MRQTTRLLPLLLTIGALPALAAPTLYTIHFTLTSGSIPASGSFSYDPSTSTFSSFVVVWNGDTEDLTSSANTLGVFVASSDPCYASATTNPQQVFLMLTSCSSDANPTYYSKAPIWITFTPTSGPFAGMQSFEMYTQSYGVPVVEAVNVLSSPANTGSAQGFFSTTSGSTPPSTPPPATPLPGSGILLLVGLSSLLIIPGLRRAARAHR